MVANLVQIQDKLKDLSDNQLRDIFSTGSVPQFMVMTEMGRRKEMNEEYQKNQAQAATTVAEDILSPANSMAQGLGALAQPQNRMATQPQNLPIENTIPTMPPSPQPMANKLPVTRMADGGLAKIKYANGGTFGEVELPPRRRPLFPTDAELTSEFITDEELLDMAPITPYLEGINQASVLDPSAQRAMPIEAGASSPDFASYSAMLEKIRNRQQPSTVFSPSLIAAEAAAQKSLTDAQADLTADSAYEDLATSLTERQEGLSGQRDEAAGLALLEAAARIAGSKSPFLGQAIGEAAPAIGTYGKSLSEVRRQENALFDTEAKLTQLKMAEKARRKEEVAKLRSELRDLDSVRRDIEDKAFTRHKTEQSLDLRVLDSEQKIAIARTTDDRQKATLELSRAKDKRDSFKLENQLGETQANISDLEDAISKGLNPDGTPYTENEKTEKQEQLKSLKLRRAGITKTIKDTSKTSPFAALTAQAKTTQEVLRLNDVITDLKKQFGGTKEIYVSMASSQSGKSDEEKAALAAEAGKAWDDAQADIKRLNQRRKALLGSPSGSSNAKSLADLRTQAKKQGQ
mgnify:CR=1 FL=1